MQAHGASAAGTPLWMLAVAIGLYMVLTLRSGVVSTRLDRRQRPVQFWMLMAALALAQASLLWGGWYLSTHYAPRFSVM